MDKGTPFQRTTAPTLPPFYGEDIMGHNRFQRATASIAAILILGAWGYDPVGVAGDSVAVDPGIPAWRRARRA